MAYRVCKSTGVIHACGGNPKNACDLSKKIKKSNYEDCRSKDEAEALAREAKKAPRYCKHCKFTAALQEEADR